MDQNIQQRILNNLSANDPHFTHLDLRETDWTFEQLETIAEKINKNDYVNRVSWNQWPYDQHLKQKIENKVKLNIKNYKPHPSDFVHGLLSSHAYIDSEDGGEVKFAEREDNRQYVETWNKKLVHWKIHKIYNYPDSGRYYSAAYINEKAKQIVLAHRGTTLKILDFFKTDSPIKTDLKGILCGTVVAQQAMSYVVTKEVIEYAEKEGFNLSFTGHSLGAWLGELSLYFAVHDFQYFGSKAVTFDSPGSGNLRNFESHILSHESEFDIRNLDITSYLSAPNFINVCNEHIGRAYRVFPEITTFNFSNQLKYLLDKPIIKKCKPVLHGLLSLAGHSLTPMLVIFDPGTDKPKKYEKILDWPCIKYKPKSETLGKEVIEKVLGCVPFVKFIPGVGTLTYKLFTMIGIGSVIEVIDQLLSGNIASAEFWEVYKHLEFNAKEGYPLGDNRSAVEEFNLFYKGHYRTQELNPSKDLYNSQSSDWYLKKLCELSANKIDRKEIDDNIKIELKEFKEKYEIILEGTKKYICAKSANVEIEDLRIGIVGLCNRYDEVKKVLSNTNAYDPPSKRTTECTIISNLPHLPNNIVKRQNVIQEIDRILNNEKFIIISAFAGTGKSTVAKEYGYVQLTHNTIVRFIDADDAIKINEAYMQLAKEFNIHVVGEKGDVIMQLVHNEFAKLKSALFIFDNVEKFEDVQPYLERISNISSSKVIITTRNSNLNNNLKIIKLNPFTREEAKSYITRNSIENRFTQQDIDCLINNLDRGGFVLPYSISKAVAYFQEDKRLVKGSDYIHHFQENADPTGTCLLLELLEKSELAWQILQYSSYLDPDFISIVIFKDLLSADEEKLQDPIKRLEDLSLMTLRWQDSHCGLQLHRLVQSSVKKYRGKYLQNLIDEIDIYEGLIVALDNLFPILTNVSNEDWQISQMLYPHAVKILQNNIWGNKQGEISNLYFKLGIYNSEVICQFNQSLEYFLKDLSICQELYQGNHPRISCTLDKIGTAYQALGNLEKALEYQEKALAMCQELYQGNHPDIATHLSNVGITHTALGDLVKGLEYQEKALAIFQELNWGNHPDVAICLNNVGAAYEALGNLDKGLEYQEKALEMLQELNQRNHPDIAKSLNNVGMTYKALGNFEKELDYTEKALAMRLELYQGNHPDIAFSLFNLGIAYQTLDVWKSVELLKQAYFMYQVLGLNNSETIKCLEKSFPKLIKKNETREFIVHRGSLDTLTLLIKQKLQENILNSICEAAAKGKWSSGYFMNRPSILGDWGVKGYLDENYIEQKLGTLTDPGALETAKMLCFEAICLGVMASENKCESLNCVKEFTKVYPTLMEKIAKDHPEYFVDGSLLRLCVSDQDSLGRLLGDNAKLSGTN